MGLEVNFTWADIGWLTGAVASLACLVWLLRAVPRSPLRTAFAVVLAVVVANGALYSFVWVDGGHRYWLAEIPDNMVAVAVVYFLAVWIASARGTRLPRWLPWAFLAAALAIQAIYVAQPAWRMEVDAEGSTSRYGPLFVAENAVEVAAGVAIAVVFFRTAVRRDSVPLGLAGLGFLWSAVFGIGAVMAFLNGQMTDRLAVLPDTQRALILVLACAHVASTLYVLGAIAYIGWRGERNRTRRVIVWSVLALLALAAALFLLYDATGKVGWGRGVAVAAGLTTLMLPVFGTLFLVSEAHVSRESRVWAMVRKGSLPAVMLATFFVVSETAQTFLSGSLGPIAGIVATAPLILLIAPIQRLGDRFGHAVVPARKPSLPEKEAIYEQQLRHAWGDGAIGAKERSRLVDLRKALGVSAERAEAIEQAVVASLGKEAASA